MHSAQSGQRTSAPAPRARPPPERARADLTTAREARTTYDNRGYARDGAETSWKGPAFVFH